MGHDITLENDQGEPVKVKTFCAGSTFAVGGEEYASITVTYNYSKWYRETLDKEQGLKWLADKSGRETLPRITHSIGLLANMGGESNNYWESCPSNAKNVLLLLARWAQDNPDARWRF